MFLFVSYVSEMRVREIIHYELWRLLKQYMESAYCKNMHFKFFHTEINLPLKNVFIRKAERKRGRGKEWKRGREVKRQRDKCVNHTRCWFTPQCPEKPDKVVPGRRREPRTQPESPTYSRDLSTEVMSRQPSPTPRECIVRAGGSKART